MPLSDLQVGDWVLVVYDDIPYPGMVKEYQGDERILVKTMRQKGNNCFNWPHTEDVAWYTSDAVRARISSPAKKQRARHFNLLQCDWEIFQSLL